MPRYHSSWLKSPLIRVLQRTVL